MWILNKRAGWWKKCAKCGQDAFKKCILNLQEDDPNLDKRIKNPKNLKDIDGLKWDKKDLLNPKEMNSNRKERLYSD